MNIIGLLHQIGTLEAPSLASEEWVDKLVPRSMSMRRSLGRLIVFFSSSVNTNCTSTRTIATSIKGSKLLNSYHFFNLSGYTQCKHYNAEAKTKAGSDFKYRSITKGDTICLNDFLFSDNRDYLIKNINQHVKRQQLEGKVIGIYFVPLTDKHPQHSAWHTALLKDVYDDLHPANNFEIVLVACNDLDTDDIRSEIRVHPSLQCGSHKVFHDLFSCMPWTAIPFSDVTTRKQMQRSFGVPEEFIFQPSMYIVDQTGMVLQVLKCDSWDIFEYYGSLGYPFSDKRLKFLRTEDYLATQHPSLKELLGSPQRDYVISNNGDKVPIHTFEDKVVALYFYHPDRRDTISEELKLAYEEFAKIKKIFEVVLVYIREPCSRYNWKDEKPFWKSEESFWEVFKTMPWLALPFKDMSYKKLKRVFEFKSYDLPRLVIFGPHADYIEPVCYRMLRKYRNEGYPFTLKKAAELENEKIKELKLEMLWVPNTVFKRNDGSLVPLSKLYGKRVMLVLETFNGKVDVGSEEVKSLTEFLTMLKERYLQKKGTEDEFEVIRILVGNTESSISKHFVGDMPWLISPGSKLMHELDSSYFWFGEQSYLLLEDRIPIFAFGPDGKLVRKTMYPTFVASEFPFYAGSLEEEIVSQFITRRGFDYSEFDYSEDFGYKGTIYTDKLLL